MEDKTRAIKSIPILLKGTRAFCADKFRFTKDSIWVPPQLSRTKIYILISFFFFKLLQLKQL